MNENKISVAIATYNGEKFIQRQLKSILEQLDENAEIIISDDGSLDNTLTVINNFNDKRITVLRNPTKGLIKNFENALKHTTGNIIFLADQDDVWVEGKVTTVIKNLEQYDMAVSDCMLVDDHENMLQPSLFAIKNSGKGVLKNLRSNTYTGCCMAFNRKLLTAALPFPAHIPMHDIWLGFVADTFFKTIFIKDKLVLYRRHTENISSTGKASQYNVFQKIKFRWQVVRYLPLLIARIFKQKKHGK